MHEIQILYEDNHLIAVNKQVSDIVQGDRTGDMSLDQKLKEFIKTRDNKPGNVFMGIPHRLDRPVSGVVVFTKTSKALSRMTGLFREKEVEKVYYAIVKNRPAELEGRLVHYLTRNTKQNKAYCHDKFVKGSKEASLQYSLIGSSDRYHLLEVLLETGRHHQIRAQLSAIGCPIKGDIKYGADRTNKNGGISLHAGKIAFTHPVKKISLAVRASFPRDDIYNVFDIDMEK